ncbi:MAG: radical SAM protein [Deltaproteobacteria bacterium]|nr:radical SAM protein [Deltaproteobacteria bacterium]
MKISLVQLPTSHHGAGEKVYPLGLSRLSSLVPVEYTKSALDMNLFPDPWPELKTMIEDQRPDIVAFSLRNIDPLAGHLVSYLSSLKTAATLVRKLLPDSRILVGGPAFSLFGTRLMEAVAEIDYGLVGEGERAFPRIIAGVIDAATVPGLLWRKDGVIRQNPPGPGIPLDEIPPMDMAAFDPADYTKGNAYVAPVGIEGKRGCDLSCGYCVYPSLGGGRMRLRSPEKIADEIEFLHREHGISLFHFTDAVVNRPIDHFEALMDALIHRKLDVGWTGFFREDTLDHRLAELAMAAGLVAIYFSADALTDHGLKLLGKRLTKQDILRAAKVTAENNILTMCHFLLNLPGDGEAEAAEAWEMLDRLLEIHAGPANLGAVIFNHVRLYPGAPLTKRLIKSGDLSSEVDLLYPYYHNPPRFSHLLHEMEAHCHCAGVFSRLKPAFRLDSSMENT